MTTSEISPRPWKLVFSDKDYVVAVFDVNMDIVANVYGYKWRPIERVSDESKGRAHANAQLFLAAPELVAALEGARRFIADVIRNHAGDVPDAYTAAAETYAEPIDALLARVRGESEGGEG